VASQARGDSGSSGTFPIGRPNLRVGPPMSTAQENERNGHQPSVTALTPVAFGNDRPTRSDAKSCATLAASGQVRTEPHETRVPDAVEPIIGWRAWALIGSGESGPRLSSIAYPCMWLPREALEAECLRVSRCIPMPGGECDCGIHALTTLDGVLDAVPRPWWPPVVLGRVALWGRVVPGTKGWRAQFAYPTSLMVMERWPWQCKSLRELESAYGVSVMPLRWRDL
jgi:hypothetical protein